MWVKVQENPRPPSIHWVACFLDLLRVFITNIFELDFEERKSDEIVLHPMHGALLPGFHELCSHSLMISVQVVEGA